MREPASVTLDVAPIRMPDDADAVAAFLAENPWPFHMTPELSVEAARGVRVATDDIATFWVLDAGVRVGLIRLLDLDDVETGSAMFDIRIASAHRGRGIGRFAVSWLTGHVFAVYPGAHRIEASTRHDNLAMRAVLGRCGYRLEGRLVEAWRSADGSRQDAMLYAILRREHHPNPERDDHH